MNSILSDKKPLVATGEFSITLSAPEAVLHEGAPTSGRHTLSKTYQGGLQGRASGEMLSAGQPQNGQASYVAIESFTGTLGGQTGGFSLAHFGEMDNGSETLKVNIVPGSGNGELTGIRGHLQIRRDTGKHFYTLTYWII
ncbi:DUF3224 domain-containing protein [Candidatus Pantoea formicae]|uniref:DUF3224 domain-containing protein n=1 Tax=Candidatus Pantoea formicae TaxID=2608355 RepID=UPI003EDAFC80